MLQELKSKGIIQDISHQADLENVLKNNSTTLYCGFDPTSDSLHVGSLLPLTTLMKFSKSGHKLIVLIGTATGMIGDPSGKSTERSLLAEEEILKNANLIEKQVSSIFTNAGINKDSYQFVRNHEWLEKISLIDFLREIGKHFSVNQMIARDSVKTRLTEREQGISYTEFSYMMLQAYDFHYLYKNLNCITQIGGSDQWGNITSGLDLIRRLEPNGTQPFGLTIPLLLNSSGKKFGKTESGNVWLNSSKTSVFEFRKFWQNTSDDDVIKLIKLFTNATESEVKELETSLSKNPEARIPQNYLADQLTILVHGESANTEAIKTSSALFSNTDSIPSLEQLLSIKSEIPTIELTLKDLIGINIQDLLVKTQACTSKSSARKLIEGGGVYLNNQKVKNISLEISNSDLIEDKAVLIRTGKKSYFLVLVS